MAEADEIEDGEDDRRGARGRRRRKKDDELDLFGYRVDSKRFFTWIAAGGAGYGAAELLTWKLVPIEHKAWSPWALAAAGLVTALNTKGKVRDCAFAFCVGSALDGIARKLGFSMEAWEARKLAGRDAGADLAVIRAELQAEPARSNPPPDSMVAHLREEIAKVRADSAAEKSRMEAQLADERNRACAAIETLQREIRELRAQIARRSAQRRPPPVQKLPPTPTAASEPEFGTVAVGTRIQLAAPLEEARQLAQRLAELPADAVAQLERELLGMSPPAGLDHLRERLLAREVERASPAAHAPSPPLVVASNGRDQLAVTPDQARHLGAIRQRLTEDTALVQALAKIPERETPSVIDRLLTMSEGEAIEYLRELAAKAAQSGAT